MNKLSEKNLLLTESSKAERSKKFDILKTFDVFSREKLGILSEKIIEIILVEADNIFAQNKKMFNIDFKKNDAVQVSVFNDRKTFDLLSVAWKRQKMKQEKTCQESVMSLPVHKGN